MLEKHYQYAQKAFPSLTEGSEFFPLWTAIGGHGYLKSMERNSKGKPTGKKIVDKTDMIGTHAYGNRTYVDLDWHPKGHMESHHFEKPLRRLRKFWTIDFQRIIKENLGPNLTSFRLNRI